MCQMWILITVLFSAVCGLATYVPRHYYFVNEKMMFSEAQSYCRQNYTDLATITDTQEMTTLTNVNALWQGTSSYAFIGLQKGEKGRWLWSLPQAPFFLSSDAYETWSRGEPNNLSGVEFCGAMFKDDGNWLDAKCDDLYTFVCSDGGDSLYFSPALLSWRDAQSFCRQLQMDLVTVGDNKVKDKVKNLAHSSVTERVWIGLFNDSWKWSDQSNSSFRYWGWNQPNNYDGVQNCAALDLSNSWWNDVACDINLNFICYQSQLILIRLNLSWTEALRYCTENYVDLVSVQTEETQGWVMEVAQNASTAHVWLGLSYSYNMDFWYWVNGDLLDYHNWALGIGTGAEVCSKGKRSGAVQSGGKQQWVSRPGTERLNFICTTY